MSVTVWSEREPGSWTECAESAYLMALVYGGFTEFPAGAYTDAERDALDEASGYPGIGNEFRFVDIGAKRRYGVALANVSGEGWAAFRRRLNTPGRAIAIAGTMGRLPAGHYLRRWQPTFTGNHAVTVIPQGNGGVLWLDPLAVDDFEGDKASVDDVMRFAWIPSNAREALEGQFKETMPTDFRDAKHQDPKIVRIRKGATIYDDEFATKVQGVTEEEVDADMAGPAINGMYLCRRLDRQGGFFWIGQDAIVPEDVVPFRRYTLDDIDCTAEIEQAALEATAAADERWDEWLATAPNTPEVP